MFKDCSGKEVCLLLGYYNYRTHLGIARYAHEAGWILGSEMMVTGEMPHRDVDGIISLHLGRQPIIDTIKSSKAPVVELCNRWNDGLTFPRVFHDNAAIGRLAAGHFLDRGFERVGYVRTSGGRHEDERSFSFREAAEAGGEDFHLFSRENVLAQLAGVPKPIGLMVQNDRWATWLMRLLLERGVPMPEDVAILGVGNDELCCTLAPIPLTSVDSNLEGIGYSAAELLDKLMDGQEPPAEPICVPPKGVVVRSSTNILAIDHAATAKALQLIMEHYSDPAMSYDEIARSCGLCRRRLDDSFREKIGRTMAKEITRLRLEDACWRLRETDAKVSSIALEVGYSSNVTLTRVFKRELGVTPGAYREQYWGAVS